MTEQMDHRAAIADATSVQHGRMTVNHARCYLASVRAAWPGVQPQAAVDNGSLFRHGHAYGAPPGPWSLVLDTDRPHELAWVVWMNDANHFEATYGIKVDDPWLVNVMEGMG